MGFNKDSKLVEYVSSVIVSDYYGVSTDTVKEWVEQGRLSGKKSNEDPVYLIPKEEFEYLKNKREQDETEKSLNDFLGCEDWEVYLDE